MFDTFGLPEDAEIVGAAIIGVTHSHWGSYDNGDAIALVSLSAIDGLNTFGNVGQVLMADAIPIGECISGESVRFSLNTAGINNIAIGGTSLFAFTLESDRIREEPPMPEARAYGRTFVNTRLVIDYI